jgi:type IV pilus assembly protein PilX
MNKFPRSERQRGAVLIVALVLLLVLTVLGTAGIRDTTMEERMAGNFRDYATALEAAETALRTGEVGLSDATTHASMAFNGSDGTYEITSASVSVDPLTASNYGISVTSAALTYAGDLLVSQVPDYYIEKLPETLMGNSDLTIGTQNQPPKVHYYRVTAKGYGVTDNSEVILQSTYFTWNGND